MQHFVSLFWDWPQPAPSKELARVLQEARAAAAAGTGAGHGPDGSAGTEQRRRAGAALGEEHVPVRGGWVGTHSSGPSEQRC